MNSIGTFFQLVSMLILLRKEKSKYIATISKIVEHVRINEAICGSNKPSTVLPKTGLTSAGIDALMVKIKKAVGHIK